MTSTEHRYCTIRKTSDVDIRNIRIVQETPYGVKYVFLSGLDQDIHFVPINQIDEVIYHR